MQLLKIKQEMYKALAVYFEPEDSEAKNVKVKQIANDIKRSLTFSVGSKPEIFGRIIDSLMVPVGDLRDIAYDIIVCHSDEPKDFSMINFIRIQAGIDVADSKQVNIQKLCELYGDIKLIEQDLKKKGCSVEEVVSAETETLTTIADVVTKHIIDYWKEFLQKHVKQLEENLPHADEVVFMLTALLKNLE